VLHAYMTPAIRLSLGLAVATLAGSSMQAQTGSESKKPQLFALEGLRAAYCIRFLIPPEEAAKEGERHFVLVPASEDEMLHPALRQVIGGQPEFRSWIPSSFCLYYAQAVQLKDQRITKKNADEAQMVGVWSVAAAEEGRKTRRDLVPELYASQGRLNDLAEPLLVPLDEISSEVSKVPDTSDDEYVIKIGKTRLIWSGRTARDSTPVHAPFEESWWLKGLRQAVWNVHMTMKPAWSHPMVGTLRVEGKGGLAKLLKASPIRFVGPLYSGGSAEMVFSR
jgi:hypothetical protein